MAYDVIDSITDMSTHHSWIKVSIEEEETKTKKTRIKAGAKGLQLIIVSLGGVGGTLWSPVVPCQSRIYWAQPQRRE